MHGQRRGWGKGGGIRCAAVMAAALVAASGAGSAGPPARIGAGQAPAAAAIPVAVFGRDDRVPVPAGLREVQEKIGLLFSARGRTVCTAFCVGRDIVATAGHCLHRIAGERPPHAADFTFARNFDALRDPVRIAGHASGAASQHVMSGATSLSVRPPIDATRDWAFVRLARPACTKGGLPVRVLPVEQIVSEAAAGRVFQIAYHRDYSPWKLALSRPCGVARSFEAADWSRIARDFSAPDTLILHTCDTGGASSGSPLLLDGPDGPEVIGINVGTYVHSRVLMQKGKVARRLKADTIANTAVASAAFADKLDAFRRAAILGSPAQVRELQALLAGRGLFAGKADGTYGPELRSAIEAYEKAEGLPVTGLASEAILKRLGAGAGAADRAPRKAGRRARS